MASIDAFLELAEASRDTKPLPRASMRRWRERPHADAQRRERMIALLVVIAAEAAMLLVLRAAMRPVPGDSRAGDDIVLLSFVAPPKAPVAPLQTRSAVGSPSGDVAAGPPAAPRVAPRHAAPTMVALPAPIRTAAPPAPPTVQFYSPDGELLVPRAPSAPQPRDLLAHRDLSRMIPGAPRADSPDFHVRPGIAPKDVVNKAAGIVGGLLAHGNAPPPDSMGLPPPKADRGLRTSGRDTDPCEDIAIDMANTSDPRLAQMAEDRYEHHCEGH